MEFVTGQFQRFRNKRAGLHIGKIQRTLEEGVVVEFDGLVLRLGVEEHVMPEFRSALRMEWLELTDEPVSPGGVTRGPAPVHPSIPPPALAAQRTAVQMSGGGGPNRIASIDGDQQEVGRATRREGVITVEGPRKFNPQVIRDDQGDGQTVGSTKRGLLGKEFNSAVELNGGDAKVVAGGFRTATDSKLRVNGSTDQAPTPEAVRASPVAEAPSDNTGRVVGKARATPTESRVVVDSDAAAAAAKASVERPRGAASKAAVTKVATTSGTPVSETASERAARVAAERREKAEAAAARAAAVEPPDPEVVAPEAVAPAPKSLVPGESVTITPTTNDGHLAEAEPGPIQLAPGLWWDRTIHWATRVKRALEYQDRPELLELILKVESAGVVAAIRKALPAAP